MYMKLYVILAQLWRCAIVCLHALYLRSYSLSTLKHLYASFCCWLLLREHSTLDINVHFKIFADLKFCICSWCVVCTRMHIAFLLFLSLCYIFYLLRSVRFIFFRFFSKFITIKILDARADDFYICVGFFYRLLIHLVYFIAALLTFEIVDLCVFCFLYCIPSALVNVDQLKTKYLHVTYILIWFNCKRNEVDGRDFENVKTIHSFQMPAPSSICNINHPLHFCCVSVFCGAQY